MEENVLELGYENLSLGKNILTSILDQVLEIILPRSMIRPSAFETIGHVAHFNLLSEHAPYKYIIGAIVLEV